MAKQTTYEYQAQPERRPAAAHPDSPQQPEPYLAAAPLIRAVNLAIFLRRPLLLEGEAGCGKSKLARAVAYELGLPFYTWYVRSTSKARDGLYTYDALLRLHDIEAAKVAPPGAPGGGQAAGKLRNPGQPADYREFGALGKAFDARNAPAVVLIDEIDKADVDFPNDLLTVIDDPWSFDIPETGERISASSDKLPIVIITSNKEKGNLPAPFLRRCIYYYVEFPDNPDLLEKIVRLHYAVRQASAPSAELIQTAAARFLQLRQQDVLHKRPGTSEFLDWLQALHLFGAGGSADGRAGVDELAREDKPLPFPELLFKVRMDWHRFAHAGA